VNLARRKRVRNKAPVVIDCAGELDAGFANLFREALGTVDLDLLVLVELKHATPHDLGGIAALAEAIAERRLAGGYAALVATSTRWRAMLRQCGIPDDWIVAGGDAAARRRIIIARAPRPSVASRLGRSSR
jgi:anti-anti-sigma regulatory factor